MAKPRVTTFVLTIAFLTAGVAAANFYVGRNEEHSKRVWLEHQLTQITAAKEALEKERDELTQAKQTLEQQLADTNRQAQLVADQLAQEKRSREALTAELAQMRGETDQFKRDLDAQRREKQTLTEEFAKAKQSYQALSNELTTLRQAKEALEKRVKEMLAARAKEAEQIVVRPNGQPAPAQPAAKNLEGKVLVVNREFNFVVLNLGSKDGLKAGSRFNVLKGDKKIGTVEVERLYENMSAANVLEEEKKGQVKEGDTVRQVS